MPDLSKITDKGPMPYYIYNVFKPIAKWKLHIIGYNDESKHGVETYRHAKEYFLIFWKIIDKRDRLRTPFSL